MFADPFPHNEKQLFASCADLGNSLDAKSFASLACQYHDLLNDQKPRLLVLTGTEILAEDVIHRIGEALPGWHIISQDQNIFADVGLVLVRASAPFRDAEAQILSRSWRRCFRWECLLTHTHCADEDDLEDLTSFVSAAFAKLTSERRQITSIWSDFNACVQSISSSKPETHLRSMLALSELRNSALEIHSKTDKVLSELAQLEKQLLNENKCNEHVLQMAREALSSIVRSMQRDFASVQTHFALDLVDEISKAKQEILSYVDNAPLDDLQSELEHLVVARAESALQVVIGKIGEEIDELTCKATDALTEVRKSAGCDFLEIGAELPIDLLPSVTFEAAKQESPDSSLATKLRNRLPSLSVGVLLAHLVNPVVGVISGLTMLGLFNNELGGRQAQAIRKDRAMAVSKYMQECLGQCQTELRRSLARLTEEVTSNVEQICRETVTIVRQTIDAGADNNELSAVKDKCDSLRNGHNALARIVEMIDQEIARQDMMRQMEDIIGGK